jgi:hypothetical protein
LHRTRFQKRKEEEEIRQAQITLPSAEMKTILTAMLLALSVTAAAGAGTKASKSIFDSAFPTPQQQMHSAAPRLPPS